MNSPLSRLICRATLLAAGFMLCLQAAFAQDLDEVRKRGVLRHLGVPYANFVTGSGDGFDVELMQGFARELGVRYEFVQSNWNDVIGDLTGKEIRYKPSVQEIGSRPVRGDVIANGMTILPPRLKLLDFSEPTFPSAVWLLARPDVAVTPIKPSGNREQDIKATKARMGVGTTFVMDNSCLDPRLYDLEGKGYPLHRFTKSTNLNDIVPAVVKGESEMSLLDVPDLIVAMEKWSGQIKVIGPISEPQLMGAGFRKTSPALRQAFDEFLAGVQKDGTYMRLVKKYYRAAPRYHPEFFQKVSGGR